MPDFTIEKTVLFIGAPIYTYRFYLSVFSNIHLSYYIINYLSFLRIHSWVQVLKNKIPECHHISYLAKI